MVSLPTSILRRLGRGLRGVMDQATGWFVATRLVGMALSPLTLAVVGICLTPVEQGYFYVMYSILGLIVFFELGLGSVVIYIVGHRAAKTNWDSANKLTGDPSEVSWLAGIYHKVIIWYGLMAVAFTAVSLVAGYFLLSSNKSLPPATYLLPFVFVVVLFALNIFEDGSSAFIEGTGRIAQVKRAQFLSGIAGSIILITALLVHLRLWSIAFSEIGSVGVLAVWLYSYRHTLAGLFFGQRDAAAVSWKHEIFPLQWRVALTWLSGYFINMAFVPILFALRGPIEAGQMGMALKISGALYTISIGLVGTKSAKLSALAATDRKAFIRTLLHSSYAAVGLSVLGAAGVFVMMLLLRIWWPAFLHRLLPLGPMMAIMGVPLIGAIAASFQIYARTQKQDPFVWANMIVAVCVVAVTLFTGLKMDASAMAYGYLAVLACVALPLHLYFVRYVKPA